MHRSTIFALFGVLVMAFAVPAPANPGSLAPGDWVESSVGYCTLAYVFDGTGALAGNVYFLTAAHCVRNVGDTVDADGFADFGTVAIKGLGGSVGQDYAFIKVDPARHADVRAAVIGHPGVPTGYTTAADTTAFDLVGFSGWGLVYEFTPITRQDRVGVLMGDNANTWRVTGPYLNGDSGGPFFMMADGKALGIESGVCIGLCTDTGPTIEGILAKAAARGFTVQLRTAS